MIAWADRRLRREERGVAMVIAVTMLAVIATLTTLVLTTGTHVDQTTARGRNFVRALQVAESGAHEAIAKLDALEGSYSGTFTGATPDGSYTVTVTTSARNRYVIESTGQVIPTSGALGVTRKLRVEMAPPVSFRNALFSQTSVETKNGDEITGDIWANESVVVEQNNIITGHITSATGYIQVNNGTTISGNLWSGGFSSATQRAIYVSTNTSVGGDAKASVTAPPDPVSCGGENPANYEVKVDLGSTIAGDVTTWGSIAGPGTVGGTPTSNRCTTAAAADSLPVFSYSASNYPAGTVTEFGSPGTPSPTALADFDAWLLGTGGELSGTVYVNQSGTVNQSTQLDLTGAEVAGDATVVANVPILAKAVTSDPAVTDAMFVMVSTYRPPAGTSCDVNNDNSECSIHLNNNFATASAVATLVYAPYGTCSIKNNQASNGVVYCDSIVIKNNQILVWDSRLERVVGFGDHTLDVTKWVELNA